MAGDWIKMRVDLSAHPRVVRIMSALRADKFRTIGGLHAVWCVFDAHATDGVLEGYTLDTMDAVIGWAGFSAAMLDAGWLIDNAGKSLEMPYFDRHNGSSAKRRSAESERKRTARMSASNADNLRTDCGHFADKTGTREEKRREEKSNVSLAVSAADESASPSRKAAPKQTDEEWLASIKASDAYAGIDVDTQIARARTWADSNRRIASRKFLLNWLNRCEKPVNGKLRQEPDWSGLPPHLRDKLF